MNRTAIAVVFAVSALMFASVLVPVQVQASGEHPGVQAQRPFQRILPVVDYNRDDVRDALRELMGNSSQSFTIDNEVQGAVTLSLHNVTFETALQNVLSQVGASYRMEGSVIHVFRKAGAPVAAPVFTGPEVVPDSNSGSSGDTVVVHDGSFLDVLRGTRMFKLRKSDLRIVAAGSVPR